MDSLNNEVSSQETSILSQESKISGDNVKTSMKDAKLLNQEDSKHKKDQILFIIASFILLATVIASVVLFALQYFEEQNTETLQASISEIDSKISTLQKDDDVRAVGLLHSNQKSIEDSIEQSKAQNAINALYDLKKAYGVEFSNFSFVNKKISTNVIVPADPKDREPSTRLVKFISDFRNHAGAASGSILEMGEVTTISGDAATRSFSVEFTLK